MTTLKDNVKVAYYKNVWQTLTTHGAIIDDNHITRMLQSAKHELLKGIIIYQPYNDESYTEWIAKYNYKDPGIQRLIQKLSISLNLHGCDVWNVFCNYLMFEYHGKISDMKSILDNPDYTNSFVESVWYFYTSERMYILKTIRYILENYDKNSNSFNIYGKYVDVLVPDIFRSLLKQLSYLITEINSATFTNCLSRKEWIDRNNREQVEIVSCLIVSMKHMKLEMNDYINMINTFKEYNFTKEPAHFEISEIGDCDIITNIRSAEIGACLVGLLHCWTDNTFWQSYIDQIEAVILPLFEEGDHAVISLAWCTLQMTLPPDIALQAYNTKYHSYITYAFQQFPFHQMYEITRRKNIMGNDVGQLIRKAMYKTLEQVCDKFDSNGEIYSSKSSCQLLSELIKEPDVAEECFINVEQGATTLYNTSLRMFPFDFSSITYIYTTLSAYEKYRKKVVEFLIKMPNYTEEYGAKLAIQVQELTLSQSYETQLLDEVFPRGTKVILWNFFGKTLLTIKKPCNYFDVFKNLINDVMISETIDQNTIEAICAGYELFSMILKMPEMNKVREIVHCVVLIAPLLLKFTRNPFKNQIIINTIFNVCTTLIRSFDETILSLLLLHNFLPSYSYQNYDIQNYNKKESINVGVIHEFILAERNEQGYDLLLSYLGLIETCIEDGIHTEKLQLPGLIYITNYVFPKNEDWIYAHNVDRHTIAGKCLNVYFLVLQKLTDRIESDMEKQIYDYCKASFMNNKDVMKSYLKIIRISNVVLNLHMHGDSNWKSGKPLQVYRNVKIALSIFVLMLNDKTMYEETLVKCVFPNERERRNFLKIIAGYMQQAFDESIAELAIIILRKIAKVSGLPMLSSLDMDYYQIQGLFLYKLRDPLVSNELKIAIVEFITTCVHTQHALTAALFNITYDQKGTWTKQTDSASDESVTQFFMEYLYNIKKSPHYLHSPLQASILNLLYNIWLYKKEILVEDLLNTDLFWPTLIDPLVRTFDLPYTAYSQIFNIISLELFKCKDNPNEMLKNTLKDMFSETELFITSWCTRLLNIIDESSKDLEDTSPTVLLLKDWKNFIVTSTRIYPDVYTDSEIRYCLIDSTVKGLVQHFKSPGISQVIGIWMELYLYLISLWPETCQHYTSVSLDSLIIINKSFAFFHSHFKKIVRASFIGAVMRTIINAKSSFTSKPDIFYEYLEPMGEIINSEFKLLFLNENKKSRLRVPENDMTWVLLCHLISYLLNMKNADYLLNWFQYYKILPLVLDSLQLFINHQETIHSAKAIVSCITYFVNSPFAKCFLNMSLISFYDSLSIPTSYIDLEQIKAEKQNLLFYEEWWQLYRGIIETNTVLLEKFGALMLQNGFSFMSLHLHVIKETFRLPFYTAEMSALKLVCSLLNYCLLLLNWKQYWHMDNHICFQHVMEGVKDSFNASISIILRPKTICFFMLNTDTKLIPSDQISNKRIKNIMDLIIDIVTSSCKCFIKSSIHITKFLEYYGTGQGTRIVENDFSVPKMQQKNSASLTFGSLLCTLHFLCKCTTQINLYRYSPNTFEPLNNPKDKDYKYASFVCQDYIIGQTTIDKFNTVQHFATSELSSMSAPWLCHLNEEKIQFGLETLATFLAEEIYITLHTDFANSNVVRYIRRELCSELQTFHEFIRKKSIDLQAQKENLPSTDKKGLDTVKNRMEMNVVNYLGTLSQWFIYICDLVH